MMRKLESIIVHCSATKENQNFDVDDIRKWHTDPKPHGNGWSDIGYHYVITRSGEIQEGRFIERPGAHANGNNDYSIGICLVGGINSETKKADANFTFKQYQALEKLKDQIFDAFPNVDFKIFGHRDLSSKECPCFDVHSFFSS